MGFREWLRRFSPEERAQRAQERVDEDRLKRTWETNGQGLTFQVWRAQLERERQEAHLEEAEYQRGVQKRTQECIESLKKICQMEPELSPKRPIPGKTRDALLHHLRKVNWYASDVERDWIDSTGRKGYSSVLYEENDELRKHLIPVVRIMWDLVQHTDLEVSKKADGILLRIMRGDDFFPRRFPDIHKHYSEINIPGRPRLRYKKEELE